MELHPVTVTFDDVSSVITSRTKDGTYTSFNFVANGRREYAVQINGKVAVEQGMTVTALLRDPNNWQTLKGWLDHRNGRIEGIAPLGSLKFAALLFGALFLVSLFFGLLLLPGNHSQHVLAICISIMFFPSALYAFVNWHSSAQIWAKLKKLKSA